MAEFKLGLTGGLPLMSESGDKLNIINFINEVNPTDSNEFKILSAFGLYVVTSGSATLNMIQNSFHVKQGDVFFTFPTKSFYLSDMDQFRYIYITFFGGRGTKLLGKAGIDPDFPIVSGKEELIPIWTKCHQMQNGSNAELLAESLILLTMASIGQQKNEPQKYIATSMEAIRNYVDTHYNDANISLQSVSKKFDYNFHYVSRCFKEKFGKSFSEYVTFVRIQKACELMDEGLTTVSNIATFIGYSDPLYFSRVFSKEIGKSPKQYIQSIKKK